MHRLSIAFVVLLLVGCGSAESARSGWSPSGGALIGAAGMGGDDEEEPSGTGGADASGGWQSTGGAIESTGGQATGGTPSSGGSGGGTGGVLPTGGGSTGGGSTGGEATCNQYTCTGGASSGGAGGATPVCTRYEPRCDLNTSDDWLRYYTDGCTAHIIPYIGPREPTPGRTYYACKMEMVPGTGIVATQAWEVKQGKMMLDGGAYTLAGGKCVYEKKNAYAANGVSYGYITGAEVALGAVPQECVEWQ